MPAGWELAPDVGNDVKKVAMSYCWGANEVVTGGEQGYGTRVACAGCQFGFNVLQPDANGRYIPPSCHDRRILIRARASSVDTGGRADLNFLST